MELFEFEKLLTAEIRNQTGEGTEIELRNVRKNNNVNLRAVVIRENGISVSPAIYLEQLLQEYEKGVPIRHLVRLILHQYRKTVGKTPSSSDFFSDFRNVRSALYCKLINMQKNRDLLQEIPYRRWNDLAIVSYYEVDPKWMEGATIQIRNEHLSRWGITDRELIDTALGNTIRNMPSTFEVLKDVLEEISEYDFGDEAYPLYVLTNQSRWLGAICLTFPGQLSRIARKVGGSYFILPSSIHETLVVPEKEAPEAGDLNRIIREVNETQVDPEEVLSDHAYYYDADLNALITQKDVAV